MSKIKVTGDLMSDEDLLPGSQTASSCCVLTWRKQAGALWGLLNKDTNPILRAPPSWPRHLPKLPLLLSPWGQDTTRYLEGHTHSTHSTFSAPTSFLIQPEGQVVVNS